MIWSLNNTTSVKPTIKAVRSPKYLKPKWPVAHQSPLVTRCISIVTETYYVHVTDGVWCQVRKFFDSHLRSTTFRIRKAEFYKLPMNASPSLPHHMSSARFDTDDDDDNLLPSASPPQIPTAPPTPTSQLTRPQMLYLQAPRHCCSLYTSFSSRWRY